MDDPRHRFRIGRKRTRKASPRSAPHRALVELAVVFLAAAGAHVVETALGGHGFGPAILVALGAAIIVAAALHHWLAGRPQARPVPPQVGEPDSGTPALWFRPQCTTVPAAWPCSPGRWHR
jgi:hypothetical protein